MLGPLRGRGREHGHGHDHGRGRGHDHGEKRHQSGLLRSWPFSRVGPRFLLLCVCSPLAPNPCCRLAAFPGLFCVRRGCDPQTIGLQFIPSIVLLDRSHVSGTFNRIQETRSRPL